MEGYLFLLLVLACPLAMFFMMRGMGGHGGHTDVNQTQEAHAMDDHRTSLGQLRRQRHELDHEIEQRQAEERSRPGSG